MSSEIKYERFLDKNITPDEKIISNTLGILSEKRWNNLKNFLAGNCDFIPELVYFGKKYGWCYRYRCKGKTLCVMFPEKKAFTVLVVCGKKEIEQFKIHSSEFNKNTKDTFEKAFQYHDGKWIYKRILSKEDIDDIKLLVTIKKNPKTKKR